MTTNLAFLISAIAAVGVLVFVHAFRPSYPQLRGGLERLNPVRRPEAQIDETALDRKTKIGIVAEHRLTRWVPLQTPDRDLALLEIPRAKFIGEKVASAAVAFAATYGLAALASLVGISIGFAIPFLASLILAALAFVGPDIDVRNKARAAREAWVTHLGAYFELVAQERAIGEGASAALMNAAEIGDSPVFARLKQELHRARWTARLPWDALEELAEDIALPELTTIADIMRLSGEEGVAVAEQLRARARNLRNAQLADQKSRAGAATERMSLPASMLGLVFLLFIATPALLRIVS